jgi:hypothetical protein
VSRRQRTTHLIVWSLLGPALAALLILGAAERSRRAAALAEAPAATGPTAPGPNATGPADTERPR